MARIDRALESYARAGVLLKAYTAPDGPFYVSLAPLLATLRRAGWTDERLAKNDLLSNQRAVRGYGMEEFWTTALAGLDACEELGVRAILLKSIRVYPYSDSNVDVLVPAASLKSVEQRLRELGWLAPGTWDSVEQAMVERRKRKLPPGPRLPSDHLAIHLYGGLSWRYQDDLGFQLRGLTREVPVDWVAPAGIAARHPGRRVAVLSADAELVVQAAHVCFENYRLTLGEAVHICGLVAASESALPEALVLAESVGCRVALRMAVGLAIDALSDPGRLAAAAWPRTLQPRTLDDAFIERWTALRRQGRLMQGAVELSTNWILHRVVAAIRRRRRRERGVEDYR